MGKNISFFGLDKFADVFILQCGNLSSTIFKLADGSFCLYSPVAGTSDNLKKSYEQLGEISILIAPNHYHNKGLQEFREAFPKAAMVCSAFARTRLQKITNLMFDDIKILEERLSKQCSIIEPQGLKTGEIWIEIQQGNDVALVVCDAFSSKFVKNDQFSETATLLKPFPKFGVESVDTYKSWAKTQLSLSKPSVMLPCHGSPVKHAKLNSFLLELIDEI